MPKDGGPQKDEVRVAARCLAMEVLQVGLPVCLTFKPSRTQSTASHMVYLFCMQEPEEEQDDDVKDAVLVTDADSAIGELVLLQLILNR